MAVMVSVEMPASVVVAEQQIPTTIQCVVRHNDMTRIVTKIKCCNHTRSFGCSWMSLMSWLMSTFTTGITVTDFHLFDAGEGRGGWECLYCTECLLFIPVLPYFVFFDFFWNLVLKIWNRERVGIVKGFFEQTYVPLFNPFGWTNKMI